MNTSELLEVYRKIASGEDPHGDFLTQFAQAFVRADFENVALLRPLALVLGHKYRLWPGAEMVSPSNTALEESAVELAVMMDAAGVVMVILHRNQRAEIVAGLREEMPDLGGVLQKLADQVKDGDGMPIGKDGLIVNQT